MPVFEWVRRRKKQKKTMQPFWHLVRRVIAQEGGNLCVISVRLETFAKHAKVTQPEARNPTEKNREEQLVPATRAVRGFNTSHMHAAQVQIRKVKSCRVEGCATEAYSLAGTIGSQFFLCAFVFYPHISMTPKLNQYLAVELLYMYLSGISVHYSPNSMVLFTNITPKKFNK